MGRFHRLNGRRARRPLAHHLHDRSLRGQTDTVRDGAGAVVGTRHRHDNRLAMAMLTRLDKKAEAYREDERLITVVAEEFEEMLDAIEAGAEDAEEFIDYRRPAVADYRPEQREPRPVDNVLFAWQKRHRYDKADPAEIDTSDLDPALRTNGPTINGPAPTEAAYSTGWKRRKERSPAMNSPLPSMGRVGVGRPPRPAPCRRRFHPTLPPPSRGRSKVPLHIVNFVNFTPAPGRRNAGNGKAY